MATITASQVQELRQRTGVGMMECKKALEETAGDLEAAIDLLRTRGQAKAAKKAGRETGEGLVESYIHLGGKIGVLIEVDCETDFVARTDAFQELVKDLSMQVAAASPSYVSREDVPAAVVDKEREIYRGQMADQKKPANVLDKIIEGKLGKFFEDACLLEQAYQRDASGKTKVLDLLNEVSAKTGEKVAVRRFARYQVGGA